MILRVDTIRVIKIVEIIERQKRLRASDFSFGSIKAWL